MSLADQGRAATAVCNSCCTSLRPVRPCPAPNAALGAAAQLQTPCVAAASISDTMADPTLQ
jgi:hypothetical protein